VQIGTLTGKNSKEKRPNLSETTLSILCQYKYRNEERNQNGFILEISICIKVNVEKSVAMPIWLPFFETLKHKMISQFLLNSKI
jgi:hypothetical protein